MWLTVISGRDAGRTVEITGERFRIGRNRDCELVLRDPGVDPVHAELRREAHGWVLDDLSSQGGTYVSTKRIVRPVTLRGDEELCFGETFARLAVSRPGAKRSRRPTLAVAAAVAVAIAVAGVTAAVLAPRVGSGGEDAQTLALPAPGEEEPASGADTSEPSGTEPAVTGGTTESSEPPATVPGDSAAAPVLPRVVFRDDFSDPGTGWEVFEGPAAAGGYEDGAYVLRITDSAYLATADSGRSFQGPLVGVTVENPSLAPMAGFGIVCGYRDQQNFYLLGVGTDGTAAIVRSRDGKLTVLTGGGQWIRIPGIPVAAPRYRIRARCDDAGLSLAVNGHRVLTAERPEPSGTVGLFAAGAVELRFDDFVVRSAAQA